MFRVFLSFSLFATLSLAFANTITTEKSSQDLECKNQLPTSFCEQLVDNDDCTNDDEDSTFRNGCLKSCGLCGENDVNESNRNQQLYDADEHPWDDAVSDLPDGETKGGCEDKIPNCSSYLSVCCQMKDAMNVSCQKTCRFCSELPVTGSTQQDPCDPTKPPSGNVDVPGQTTTTTQSPIPGMPGISTNAPPVTIDMPGQTTTTTTTPSPIPGNPYPGNPIG
ncbi:hypothetical protein Ocin01_10241 [Orchesella cincta]|uniref:ShKT domain-containing protein n=1 Tax=Orchesella cincta TaxID=48709 RepID=A0A1D2MTT1_ORCCI|nr:hypothetical protein Ocin01_10241 [Orchesella cincta]